MRTFMKITLNLQGEHTNVIPYSQNYFSRSKDKWMHSWFPV